MPNYDPNCPHHCQGGRIFMTAMNSFVPCPHCSNIERAVETPNDVSGKSIYDILNVPTAYRKMGVASKELFNVNGLQGFSANSINEVIRIMDKINEAIYNYTVYQLSVYIYISNLVDTYRFIYGAQRMALEKNLKVTPLISANTLYGLQKVGDYSLASLKEIKDKKGEVRDVHPDLIQAVDGYRVVQETNLTYFDFRHADICFIEATAHTTEKGWAAVADILSERAKNDLPTYVIGYWATKSPQAGKGLRYLLNDGGVTARLNKLTPIELKTHREENPTQGGISISQVAPQAPTVQPTGVSAGVSIFDL